MGMFRRGVTQEAVANESVKIMTCWLYVWKTAKTGEIKAASSDERALVVHAHRGMLPSGCAT